MFNLLATILGTPAPVGTTFSSPNQFFGLHIQGTVGTTLNTWNNNIQGTSYVINETDNYVNFSDTSIKNIVFSGEANATLTSLYLVSNSGLTTCDITRNTLVTYLQFSYQNLTAIDLSKNTVLNWINLSYNNLTSASVNSILADLVANGVHNGSLFISTQSPVAPPTGQGITDKATLISRGWNVTTD